MSNKKINKVGDQHEARRLVSLTFSIVLITTPLLMYLYNLKRVNLNQLEMTQVSQRITENLAQLAAYKPTKEVTDLIHQANQQRRRVDEEQITLQQYRDKQLFFTVIVSIFALMPLLFEYLRPASDQVSRVVDAEYVGTSIEVSGHVVSHNESELAHTDAKGSKKAENVVALTREERISLIFGDVQLRLMNELNDLRKRSNIHLAVGILVTGASVSILYYLTTRPHADLLNTSAVLTFFLPRLFTIALVETFAYFFLRLYKNNRDQIAFYQNERSTFTALELAWKLSDWPKTSDTSGAVIRQIAGTDRNARDNSLQVSSESQSISEMMAQIIASMAKSKDKTE